MVATAFAAFGVTNEMADLAVLIGRRHLKDGDGGKKRGEASNRGRWSSDLMGPEPHAQNL